jgi:hypothetical protein
MTPEPSKTPNSLPDFDPGLENDSVWNLLDEASPTEISPRFAADALHRIRLETSAPMPWWQKLLSPGPLLAGAATAAAALVIVVSLPENPTPVAPQVEAPPATPGGDWENLEDTLAQELLSGAAEDPSLLSDEEIVALLY